MSDNKDLSKLIHEPNFTKIPNVVLDHWLSNLTPHTSVVLLFICRKTFGYQGKNGKDNISLSQITKGTNMSKNSVLKSIKILESELLIKRTANKSRSGDKDSNTYEIFIHKEEEIKNNFVVHDVNHVVHDVNQGSARREPRVVHDVNIQKKTYKRKYTKEKQQQQEVGDVDNLNSSSFEQHEPTKKESFDKLCRKEANSIFKLLSNQKQHFGDDWLIEESVIISLCKKECPSYVLDQVLFMISKHRKALEMIHTSKANLAKPVNNPIGCLKYFFKTNQAESLNKKNI